MSPVINETKEEEVKKDSGIDVTPLKEKPKKRRKTRVKKTQVEEKETDETSNKATIETEKDNKKEGLSLDDILPI
jgi:hypothetical protein